MMEQCHEKRDFSPKAPKDYFVWMIIDMKPYRTSLFQVASDWSEQEYSSIDGEKKSKYFIEKGRLFVLRKRYRHDQGSSVIGSYLTREEAEKAMIAKQVQDFFEDCPWTYGLTEESANVMIGYVWRGIGRVNGIMMTPDLERNHNFILSGGRREISDQSVGARASQNGMETKWKGAENGKR